jgi:Rps23 Pro-64 3,4-dihydroxylase Tpa1-like proline 4-hydroxylase
MRFFDKDRWEPEMPRLHEAYVNADPFPHIMIDNFLNAEELDKVVAELKGFNTKEWINYIHVNENKRGFNIYDELPTEAKGLIQELNSEEFLSSFLEKLTGITGLKSDFSLEGGGLHESHDGGFLNIHADYLAHPHQTHWRRRANVLIYLNKDWQDDWGGHLELWSRDMKEQKAKIAPLFNRCVVFSTDETSFHGHPEPMKLPQGRSRRSVALYYFTEQEAYAKVRSTHYRPRPSDKQSRRWLIELDNFMVNTYTRIKRNGGMSDKIISKLLKIMSKGKE